MSVLVAYASRHGATQGIAERIAERLRSHGLDAEARPAGKIRDVAAYDAVVVGSAAYMFHLLGDATRFIERNLAALVARPVWLFSSGPLGTHAIDDKGREVLVTSEPKEFAGLRTSLRPRGTRVFFGAWDPAAPPKGVTERLVRLMPGVPPMPGGDFRDWQAIDAWADSIAAEMVPAPVAAG